MADGKQEGGTEKLVSFFFLIIIILIVIYVIYHQFTPQFLNIVRWVRIFELWLITLVTEETYAITTRAGDEVNVEQLLGITKDLSTSNLDTTKIALITSVALTPFKWITMVIIGLIGIWTFLRGPGTHYTKVFNLDSFIRFQSNTFSAISPFVDFNPSNQTPRPPGSNVPAELPPFAEALGPEEWLSYYQIPFKNKEMNKNVAFKAFARQLGPRWKGIKNLAPYKQILLAVCCLKAARKRDAADTMLGRLSRCWSHDKGLRLGKESGLLREARKILKNKELSHPVLKNCNQHAWETTALLRALLTARENGGVLPSSQFVWLRAYDRNLWYPLNNLGRQSNHTEAIGAIAHFKAEKRALRPIPKPKVQDAVESIENYMESGNARPIPALDYSQSKNKRGIKKLKQA